MAPVPRRGRTLNQASSQGMCASLRPGPGRGLGGINALYRIIQGVWIDTPPPTSRNMPLLKLEDASLHRDLA